MKKLSGSRNQKNQKNQKNRKSNTATQRQKNKTTRTALSSTATGCDALNAWLDDNPALLDRQSKPYLPDAIDFDYIQNVEEDFGPIWFD